MSDITHSDYCPEDRGGALEDCESCMAALEAEQSYYRALFDREPHYTREELEDAYSHPSDRHKLISLTGE